MAGEVFAGIGALKSAFDMAKGLKNMSDTALRNVAVIELQEEIIVAQTVQSELIDYINTLEKRLASFDEWDAEKQRYELKEFGRGAFAYSLKADAQSGEPAHQICPTCYENRRKSILQTVPGNNSIGSTHHCPVCETQVAL